MSEPMTPDERSELAAEYALGLLDGSDLARAVELVRSDQQFADEVAGWLGWLAPLFDEVEPVTPPARVLTAIEQRLSDRAGDREPADNVHYLRRRVNLWRGFSVAASAIAASLALVVVMRPQTIQRPPAAQQPPSAQQEPGPLVAMMEAADSEARMVATWDPGNRSLVVAVAAGISPVVGQSHELWVIPADGTPRSMGILPGVDPIHLRVGTPMARQLAEGATLALSVEPIGGSPTGLPTGPVIAAGKLERT